MMIFDRQPRYLTAAFAVAVALSFAALRPQPAEATPLHRDASPFCLLPGSSNGPGGAPQICGYYDYQECLQAAADMHANCVENIDFRGSYERTPDGWRARY
ncbi:DUF3551 domain-containing protein [Tardiphaga robiniae]|uniref:DUF3551 domain-containing protein n=1 Tax=Tardiphaga robiniae TaxID=943830 RepID=UPI000838BAD3